MKGDQPQGPVLLMNQSRVALSALMSLHKECETEGDTRMWFAVNEAITELQKLRHVTYHWSELSDISTAIDQPRFRSQYQMSLDRAYTLSLLGANTYPSSCVQGQVSFWVDSSDLCDLVVGDSPCTVIGVAEKEVMPLRIPPAPAYSHFSMRSSQWQWEDFSIRPNHVGQQACPMCSGMFQEVYLSECEQQGHLPRREASYKNKRVVVGHSPANCPFIAMTQFYSTIIGKFEAGEAMKDLKLGNESEDEFATLVWRHKFHLSLMREAAKSQIALEELGA